ncbi:TetR/AcrR family transcriptional regulator [Nesterenkonia lacusekhoensis]|uniref:AcrR family transcriptional regulator n=1 Tax=Nesterenkonia lacusekhoensis TaxID=150832 RepID=A0ABS4SZ73_9MICC|nr:TetR/AcrR family transcriptional regulator [Nesterenkonia lacusekhoensis]MBP2317508.1 AcrR family transcriptional regulator [Nesterenkonia lacusekhoensis]
MSRSPDVINQLIRTLDERGWSATTVDELAKEAGISRATFFRVYGSKEDLVFADHEEMIERLHAFLERTDHDIASAMREGLTLVFRYHLEDEARTLARHRLLKQSTQLRNRELLTSHTYERIFRRWLRRRLGSGPAAEAVAVSLSGAAVALHNAYLRTWLAEPSPEVLGEVTAEAKKLIHVMLSGYEVEGSSRSWAGTRGPHAVVALVGESADTEEICEAVRSALNHSRSV